MTVFCGIDWADDHHDFALVDDTGTVLLQQRISDDVNGWAALLEALAAHGDSADAPIEVAVETSRGLPVSCLRATGRPVFAIIGPRTMEHLDDLLAGVDVTLTDEILDRIDEIVQPGTDIGTLDMAYDPPAIEQARLRRRPVDDRAAA
jgi:hypothetical protein